MLELVPLAVIHIGISLGLAAVLLLAYRKLSKDAFLIYWALFWANAAVTLAFGIGEQFLIVYQRGQWPVQACVLAASSMILAGPALMLCAAASVGKNEFSHRAARKWLAAVWAVGACGAIVYYAIFGEAIKYGPWRPLITGFAVIWFSLSLASSRGRGTGPGRWALVALSLLYCLHSFLWGASGLGLHFYPNAIYSPWAAVNGMLLQLALTMVFTYQAFERGQASATNARESDRRFRSLLEKVRLAGLILDREGRVVFCNQHLADLLGRPAGEVVGADWFDAFLPPSGKLEIPAVFENGMKSGEWPAVHEYPLRSNGELLLQWYHTTLLDPAGAIVGVASLGVDVTQQRFLEEQLRHTQTMETLGRMACGLAHDFNNYLTAINGFSDLLLRKLMLDDPARIQVQHIRTSGARAADLAGQLLAFGRQQPSSMEPLSLNAAIRNSEGILRQLVRSEIELVIVLEPNLGMTLADAGHLNQVLLNLAMNAGYAIERAGTIAIRTSSFTGQPASHLEGSGEAGDYVVLEVEDTGAGIDPRIQRNIFEPFFTTKPVGEGTGLGLATVYGIVKQAGGWVDLTSLPGAGSTFRVSFPRVTADEPAVASIGGETLPAGHGTLLLVEDRDEVRELADAALSAAGYHVLKTSNAADALKVAADPSLGLSLLISDVVMPGMRGDELADRFAELHPAIPILLISGYSGGPDDLTAKYPYLQKPFTPSELCAKVAAVLRSPLVKP